MPHVELPQAEFKVAMLGDSNAGKTSLVLRFAEGYYRDAPRSATVGAFFITKRIQTSGGITCKIQIWDTAGQTQFRSMAPMYYRNAAAAIVCYDVTSRRSYQVMKEWLEELHRNIPAGSIVIAIAATKSDLMHCTDPSTLVPTSEAEELAAALEAIFVDTSAKDDNNVELLFRRVAERVLQFRENAKRGVSSVHGDGIPVTPGASIDGKGNVVRNGAVSNGIGENGTGQADSITADNGINGDGRLDASNRGQLGGEGYDGNRSNNGPLGDDTDKNSISKPPGMCDPIPMGCGVLADTEDPNGGGGCTIS
uniref:Uncharacterized protein n=1 Tax=Odontella aurita TaxID=265563 RepID=A0A7S4K342_9STRA|mmetsp:Transcript_605/g.1857  ORF Transcript_605/g.1857 Transcript_605/m.1857 type:complete len:309 (+) Transcript_605:150-1076(+)